MRLFWSLVIVVTLSTYDGLNAHDLLTPLQKYAAEHPEHTVPHNQYALSRSSFLSRLWHWLAPRNVYSFTSDLHGYILNQLIEVRQQFKNTDAQFMRVPKNSRVYLWGDLYGSFHALMRDLSYLQQQQIIGVNLHITENSYFVFNGNTLAHTHYPLETLTVLCMLMRKNPNNVFYIRGPNESNAYWRREKLVTTGQPGNFEQQLTDFFATLPQALFIALEDKPQELIRISHSQSTYNLVDEQTLGENLDVKVVLQTEKTSVGMQPLQGLALQSQINGASAWTVFSAPNVPDQQALNFSDDALTVIDCKDSINNSTIALISQHAHEKNGFSVQNTYRLVTGAPQDSPAFTQPITDELWISSTMPPLTERTTRDKNIQQGMALCINEKNKQGGMNGTLLRTITTKGDYRSYEKQRELLEFFKKNSLDIVLLPALPLSFDHDLYFYFPTLQSNTHMRHSISIKANNTDEATVLVNALLDNYSLHSCAFFYQDDPQNRQALQAAHKALEQRGITAITDIPYHAGDIEFYTQTHKLREVNPDAIGFFATPQATKTLLDEIGLFSLASKKLFALSTMSEAPFKYFLKKEGLNMLFASSVPNPFISDLEIVNEYRKVTDANHGLYSVAALEAYVATSLFIHALETVGAPYANEKVMDYLEALKDFNFKGMTFSWNAQKRTLGNYVWIETSEGVEWKKYTVDV